MDKLKKLVDSSVEDEINAADEYGAMIEATKSCSLPDESKELVRAMLTKIQTDEKTHKMMLLVIQEVINEDAKDK